MCKSCFPLISVNEYEGGCENARTTLLFDEFLTIHQVEKDQRKIELRCFFPTSTFVDSDQRKVSSATVSLACSRIGHVSQRLEVYCIDND